MIEQSLESITERDLQALIGRSEGRRLDFKQDLPRPESDKNIEDFLADVVAFANAEGGDIIVGMEEDDGIAVRLHPITIRKSLDEEILTIENRVKDCVDVRLPEFYVHPIPLEAGGFALVLRIPASLLAPHRYTHKKLRRFMRRHSRGNVEMDATEIRQAFGAAA